MCLPLKIDLRVNVRGVDGNVPQPSADGIDIDSGAEQVGRRRMTDGVWANTLALQRRTPSRRFTNVTAQ